MTTAAELKEITADLAKVAASQTATAAGLQKHIDKKAQEIGDKRGVEYAKAAREQIDEITKQAKIEIQRRDDVITELRLQLEVQVRHADEDREAKARLAAVRLCKVWHDDLGRGYVFADEVAHAFDPDTYPAPKPARLDANPDAGQASAEPLTQRN